MKDELNEIQELTPEQLAHGYFVCPTCKQLAEKHHFPNFDSKDYMCTQCGKVFSEEDSE